MIYILPLANGLPNCSCEAQFTHHLCIRKTDLFVAFINYFLLVPSITVCTFRSMNKNKKCTLATYTSTLLLSGLIFGLLLNTTYADQISLTHRYSFDDGTASDSIGNTHGSLENGASIADGKLVLANNGIDTDPATGQYVSLSGNILNTRNLDRKSTRLNSSHSQQSRMPSSA